MADTFATVDELRVFTQMSGLDELTGAQALTQATALVQSEAAQRFVAGSSTVLVHAPHGSWVELPQRPVVTVTSVAAFASSPTPKTLIAGFDYVLIGGMLYASSGGWSRFGSISVDYDHGFDLIPEDIRAITLTVAARLILNPQNMRSETIGAYSYTLGGDASGVATTLSAYERAVARRYRVTTHAMGGAT